MSEKKQTRQAAALRYDSENNAAPVVVAVGQGHVADRIVEKAEEHNVPIVEDNNLALMLAKLSVGDQIPRELYTVVAQMLVFISRMDASYAQRTTLEDIMRNTHMG